MKKLISCITLVFLCFSLYAAGFMSNLYLGPITGVDTGICWGSGKLNQAAGLSLSYFRIEEYDPDYNYPYGGALVDRTYVPVGPFYQIDGTIPFYTGKHSIGWNFGASAFLGVDFPVNFDGSPVLGLGLSGITGLKFSINNTHNILLGYKGTFEVVTSHGVKFSNSICLSYSYKYHYPTTNTPSSNSPSIDTASTIITPTTVYPFYPVIYF